MTELPLLIRLTTAIQKQHDANLDVQALAGELMDHAAHAAAMTARLQKSLIGEPVGLDASIIDMTKAPRVIRGGPTLRGEPAEYAEPKEAGGGAS